MSNSLYWTVLGPFKQILLEINLSNISIPLFWAVVTHFWFLTVENLSNVAIMHGLLTCGTRNRWFCMIVLCQNTCIRHLKNKYTKFWLSFVNKSTRDYYLILTHFSSRIFSDLFSNKMNFFQFFNFQRSRMKIIDSSRNSTTFDKHQANRVRLDFSSSHVLPTIFMSHRHSQC